MKFVIFRIADLEFGMDIAQIQEIVRPVSITLLPQSPEYIEGVVNLRGQIITVMNLSRKLGLTEVDQEGLRTRFIVSTLFPEAPQPARVAFRVHAVFQVVDLDPAQLDPPPRSFTFLPEHAVLGIAKIEDRIVYMLNVHELLTPEEKLYLQSA
ncbi:MAG: purine-binding chemotaxis protein CheW [Nitrospirae bacterium]|nr:purine-binding chemotaxis protein CheW [Nitrospirota bacterium]